MRRRGGEWTPAFAGVTGGLGLRNAGEERIADMAYYLKHPGSVVDYRIDWTLDGRSVAESLWTVEPVETGGLAVDGDDVAGGRATARIAGGVRGHVYSLSNRVTLSDGSRDVRAIALRVEER